MIYLIATLAITGQQATANPATNLVKALAKLDRVSFDYRRVCEYKSTGYLNDLPSKLYVEFGHENLLGARYRAVCSDAVVAFNGTSHWCRADKYPWEETGKKLKESINAGSLLKNNIIGLSKCILAIESDKLGTIEARTPTTFKMTLNKRLVTPLGLEVVEFSPVYTVTLNPDTHLPTKVVQAWGDGKDTITTTFTNWNFKPTTPKDSEWLYKG